MAAGVATTGASSGLPEPIFTRQSVFAIPFQMNSGYQPAKDPATVFLFVSDDHGRTWQLEGEETPDRGRFACRTTKDGEYWFAIRTAVGNVRPQTPGYETPGLRVVVDTTPPTLDLTAERGSGGQIVVRYRATELHPKLDSLKIQYRTSPDQPWQAVAIRRSTATSPQDPHPHGPATSSSDSSATENVLSGEASWWQAGPPQRVEIRGEIADLAGNIAISHSQLAATIRPAAIPRRIGPETPNDNEHQTNTKLLSGSPRVPPMPDLNAPDGSTIASTQSPWRPLRRWPPREVAEESTPPASVQREVTIPAHSAAWRPDRPAENQAERHSPSEPLGTPPVQETPASTAAPSAAGSLGSDRCRVVNSLTFALDYDLAAANRDAGQRLELWGTHDGGRSWTSHGAPSDNRSSFVVTTKEEGLYGFRVSISSATSEAGKSPPSGATPDIWVVVQLAKPAADSPGPAVRVRDVRSASTAAPNRSDR